MEISRPTFKRILLSAREKVADSLINGKMIRIDGSNFIAVIFVQFNVKIVEKSGKKALKILKRLRVVYACPDCGSVNVICEDNCKDKFCHKNCWRYRGMDF